jgi:small subunit ribosomal protein S5
MSNKYKNVELVKPSGLELKIVWWVLIVLLKLQKVVELSVFCYCSCRWWKWVVGHGLGKSKDVSEAIAKAVEDAKKNLVKIPLNGQSVPHEQKVNLVVHVYS